MISGSVFLILACAVALWMLVQEFGRAPTVVAPPPVATEADPDVVAAADEAGDKARIAERKRKGRSSTILTSAQGLGDDPGVQSQGMKTLLGG